MEQALADAEKAHQMAPWNYGACAVFAGLLASAGHQDRAAELIAKLPAAAYGAPISLAIYHAIRGELDLAAEWYAKGIEQRDPRALPTRYILGPQFHYSAHWPRLAKMMKLPQTMTSRSF